jgi:hypothetical protein
MGVFVLMTDRRPGGQAQRFHSRRVTMSGEETSGLDDVAKAIELELAPSLAAIAEMISGLRSILVKRPELSNDLSNAIGLMQEAVVILEDIPNDYDPNPPTPKIEI